MKKKIKILSLLMVLCAAAGVFAACTSKTVYVVSFKSNGVVIHEEETDGKSVIGLPETPVRDGYIFEGWFLDSGIWRKSFTENSLVDAPVTSSLSVFAKWREITDDDFYAVSVEEETGCTVTPQEGYGQRVFRGGTYKFGVTLEDGYDRSQITVKANGGVLTPDAGGYTIADINENIKITVEGVAGNSYRITYNYNGATSGNALKNDIVYYQSEYMLVKPGRTGYVFMGWYDAAEDGERYSGAEGECLAPWTEFENKMLYARWQSNISFLNYTAIEGGTAYKVTALEGIELVTAINIAPEYEGKPVTVLGEGIFRSCVNLKTVEIPDSIKTIEAFAFYQCFDLRSVSFGTDSQLTSIGDYAFSVCGNLTSFDIPRGVNSIGDYAFADCGLIGQVTLKQGGAQVSVGNSAFQNCIRLSGIVPESGRGIADVGAYAFFNCARLTAVTLSAGTTFIGESAFYGCAELLSVTFSGSAQLTDIGASAFYGCGALAGITLPDSVETVGESAFANCIALTAVNIPERVAAIGDYAFYGCIRLTAFTVHTSNPAYAAYNGMLYNKAKTVLIVCPAGKTGGAAVAEGTERVENYAFYLCKQITGVSLPDSLIQIGDYAFAGASKLSSAEFTGSSGLTVIGAYAFYQCIKLTAFTVPADVAEIGSFAFADCSAIYAFTFEGSRISRLDGVFSGCVRLTEITVPASVSAIGLYTFRNCVRLESVAFGTGSRLSLIGVRAFEGCAALKTVVLPETLMSIANYAFADCGSLISVTLERGSAQSATVLGGGMVFAGCNALSAIYLPGNDSLAVYRTADFWRTYASIMAVIA